MIKYNDIETNWQKKLKLCSDYELTKDSPIPQPYGQGMGHILWAI